MISESDFTLSRSQFIESNKGNLTDFYVMKQEIGKGAYGVVYLAHVIDKPEKVRAIKTIKKVSLKQPIAFFNEINILMKLDHPNIIKIYETFEDEKNYYVITDFCEGGELFDRLSDQGSFSQIDARQVFKQILYAIKYCHSQQISHRDLKPQNFLFLEKKSLSLKIIDFGLSFQWKDSMRKQLAEKKQNKLIGTSYYIAPEILKGSYDEKCDIWSLGVILYILVTAAPPFDGDDDRQIMKAVSLGDYSLDIPEMKNVSPILKDLIKKILVPDSQRLTIDQIYNHPWMLKELEKKPLRLNYGKIINFSKYSKLKKIAVSYIASQMSGKEIEKLGMIFKQIDLNHDGFITTDQLKTALDKQKQHASRSELQKLLSFIDTDHNGKINYSEFVACCLENSVIFKQQNLLSAFTMLDKDHSGTITPQQLKTALIKSNQQLSDQVINEIITSCDRNKDGVIDFKQFLGSISQL